MIVILAGLAAFAIAALLAAMLLVPTFGARHRKPLHVQAREFAADLWAALAKVNGLRTDDDEGWTDGELDELAGRKQLGPQPPARRPRVPVALLRGAAIIRAVPVERLPWLQHGHGFSDSTGTFAAIAATPPALHADESFSLTEDEIAAGLAQHAEEWGQ